MSEDRPRPGQEDLGAGTGDGLHLVHLRAKVETAARRLWDAEDLAAKRGAGVSSVIDRFLFRRLAWVFAGLRRYIGALDAYLAAAESSTQASLALLRQRAAERERDAGAVRARLGELETGLQRSIADIVKSSARFDALESRLEALQSACTDLQGQMNRADETHRRVLGEWYDGVSRQHETLSARIADLGKELRQVALAVSQLEERCARERRERDDFTEQMRRSISNLQSSVEAFQSAFRSHHAPLAQSQALDRLYRDFQNAFRGSTDEIKSRLGRYLPELATCGAGGGRGPVLDVACGRGEWLELLIEHGLRGEGVDSNSSMVEMCRKRGLEVHEGDAIDFLESQPEGKWGAVTVFHLIEHLTFDRRIRLLSAAFRSLASGGLLILETPNPENLLVAAHNFYMDPTHERPIPPRSLEFFVQASGFASVRILRLHPYPDSYRLPDEASPATEKLNALLFGPQDYAILASKP